MNQDLKLIETPDGKKYYQLTLFKKNIPHLVLFDVDDLDLVKMYNWKIANNGYVSTSIVTKGNKTVTLNMHRLIMNHNGKVPANMDIDHINNNKLDNQKENLQILSKSENIQKSKKPKSKTGHIGIYFDEQRNKYRVNFKNKYIGRFDSLEEAVNARKQAEDEFKKENLENSHKQTAIEIKNV